MTNPDPFRTYLRELRRNLSTGSATEHTHRSALQALLEALGDGVRAINEPQRVECGAPDYILTRGGTPIGYVEAKDIGTSLDAAERSEQLGRYRASLNNLILTDYLEFRWYVEENIGRRPGWPPSQGTARSRGPEAALRPSATSFRNSSPRRCPPLAAPGNWQNAWPPWPA